VLPPGATEGLFRGPPLAAQRPERRRGAALRLTWLDTAGFDLAEAGLALEAPRRGPRRLIRALPAPDAPWRPGLPAAVLRELDPGKAPREAGDATLLPFASFEGRRSEASLAGGVEATLLVGTLRSVAAEQPAARLLLRGPAAAVLATMRALAEARPALPPRASLAEEARALARGEPPRPRRLGALALGPDLSVEDALARAIGHYAEVMLWHAPAAAAGATPEGVHQMRVALRRLRSLLRAFRPACDGASLRDFDAGLKDLAGALGPARDWDVWLGGLGAELAEALPEEPRIAALRRAATERRDAAYAALRPVLDGPGFRRLAWDAVALAETRPWQAEGDAAVAERRNQALQSFGAALLARRWRRIAEAGEAIDALPDADFHALRIEAKRMRYAAELFAPLWGRKKAKRVLSRLAVVQDAFGLANDAAVARGLMAELGGRGRPGLAWATGVAEGWALARARRARQKATRAWDALISLDPFWNQ
jgi:CHAD domain-containing protein